MAGGKWDDYTVRRRPGVYVNFQTTREVSIGKQMRGTMILPMLGHDYGPEGEFVTIYNNAPDAQIAKVGYSIGDDTPTMLLLRQAMQNARCVIMYFFGGGTKAKAQQTLEDGSLTATAMYAGERGNALAFSIVGDPDNPGAFDVTVYLDGERVGVVYGVSTVEGLAAAGGDYIVFSGSGTLEAVAGMDLSGGANKQETNADIVKFLDATEHENWNCLCFNANEDSLKTSCLTKIKYLRESRGKCVNAAVPEFNADYEGIINVTKGVVLETGEELTSAQACAWVAGATAAASKTQDLTYTRYTNAVSVVDEYSHEEAEEALGRGEFFFTTREAGQVIVESDINSLVTFTETISDDYANNQMLRVYDSFNEDCQDRFGPNKYPCSERGWDTIDGLGAALLEEYYDDGAIEQPEDGDFAVDRTLSGHGKTYITARFTAVGATKQSFITVKTG